jgi:PBP1b-binding outer membrane lipoprotein LpoB
MKPLIVAVALLLAGCGEETMPMDEYVQKCRAIGGVTITERNSDQYCVAPLMPPRVRR